MYIWRCKVKNTTVFDRTLLFTAEMRHLLKVPGSYAHAHRHMYFCLQIIESSIVYRPVLLFYLTCADEAWMIITHRNAPILTAVKTSVSLNRRYLMSHASKIPAQLYQMKNKTIGLLLPKARRGCGRRGNAVTVSYMYILVRINVLGRRVWGLRIYVRPTCP